MSAPFLADHVGSLLRPDWLTEARALELERVLEVAHEAWG